MSLHQFGRISKDVAAALGVTGLIYSAYTASGLPIPATIYQVELRVAPINEQLKVLSAVQIETQRSVLAFRKGFLRDQRYSLDAALATADPANKITLTRRLGEISDEINDIEKQDDALSKSVQQLRTPVKSG